MRPAITSDIIRIISILRVMHAESRVKHMDFDPTKIAGFLQFLLDDPKGILLIDGEPICGVLMGMVQETWFGKDLEAFNLPIYVLPENRGGRYAVRLINGYKAAARAWKVSETLLYVNSDIDPDRTNQFISKMGFRPIGGSFVLRS